MRADRLVAILLLLQHRGQVTAAEVAEELEVSERTARRDLDALGMAGLPVYSVQGRNGGWRLAGGGRTDLSGLSLAEAQALFLVAGPRADATAELKAAVRKLVRALPEPLRDRAEAAAGSMVVDPVGWGRSGPDVAPAHLPAVQQAVIDREQVRIAYRDRTGAETERVVHPLGVVAKGSVWYLLTDTEAGRRTFRIDRIHQVERTGEAAATPPGFDLAAAWHEVSTRVDELRAPISVRATATRDGVGLVRMVFGTRAAIGAATDDGRVQVELRAHSVRAIAAEIAGFGSMLEVHEPAEVRAALAGIAHELVATYGSGPAA